MFLRFKRVESNTINHSKMTLYQITSLVFYSHDILISLAYFRRKVKLLWGYSKDYKFIGGII